MNSYGYPTITLKDKETGRVKKEISCKNIQTIPAKMMFSGIGYSGERYKLSIRPSSSNDPIRYIYTMPYRMPKTPYYYMNDRDEEGWRNYLFTFPDGQDSRTRTDVTGVENVKFDKDANGRTIIIFKGVLYAPESGVRKIGTIAVNMNTDGTEFYTPLDEIIVQDSATVVDITYKVIVSGDSEKEYVTNLSGVLSYSSNGDGDVPGRISFPLNYRSSVGGIGSDTIWEIDDDKVIFGLSDTNVNSSQYNGFIMSIYSGDDRNAEIERHSHNNIMSPTRISTVSYENMKKSGSIVGCIGAGYKSISPESIKRISNGKGVSTTFSKTRTNINSSIKPFFEASSIKKGTGSIKAISATERRGFPERWEIDVLKGGTLADSEFRVRKTIVSGYWGNSNLQSLAPVSHLSYQGNINGMIYKKYNHPDGIYYESAPSIWPLYGQNIAIVIRKGVLLTSVGNSRYIVLDETNLPHENRGIQITGIAWDDSKKGLLIGCGESGLYKVEFDNDTDDSPVVKRVTKDGIERVYAISGNGKGGVAIITDAGIMHSNNLGETWSTKPFSVVKKQLMGTNSELDATFDYENKLKYDNMAFVLSRDGNRVGICLLRYDYSHEIPFIELKTEKKGSGTPYKSSEDFYQYYPMAYNEDRKISLVPICIGPQKAEAEKTTVRDMVNSEKYSLQPGASWGISIDGRPVMIGYDPINIAYGDMKKTEYGYSISGPTSNEYPNSKYAILDSKNNPLVADKSEYLNVISNGRWSIGIGRDNRKTFVSVAGPNIGISKDNPDIFDYYSSESQSFTKSKESKFKTSSNNFEIDGVRFSASGDNFVAGDCFVFHRTYSYVDDNVSTASFAIEESCLPVSNEFEQSGTISEENNKPKYRHPICTKTNMYLTRDGRLKTRDRTHTILGYLKNQYPQYILPGSSKMKFDLSTLKGTFLISIKTHRNSGEYLNYKNIFVSNIGSGISYHCNTSNPSYIENFLFPTNQLLANPGAFSVTIDSEKMGVTVNDGDKVIWTSGSDYSGSYQVSYVTIVPVTTSKASGTIKVGFTGTTPDNRLNGDEINVDPEMKLPTFEYAYRGVLCTRLGNEGLRSGTFDPVFYGLPFIGSPDMINIEIDGRNAEVVYSTNLDLHPGFFVKSEKPNRGGVAANISAGQVKIEPYTGLVFFSDEDIGKPYRIRYKYYKGDSLGIGEEIIE